MSVADSFITVKEAIKVARDVAETDNDKVTARSMQTLNSWKNEEEDEGSACRPEESAQEAEAFRGCHGEGDSRSNYLPPAGPGSMTCQILVKYWSNLPPDELRPPVKAANESKSVAARPFTRMLATRNRRL